MKASPWALVNSDGLLSLLFIILMLLTAFICKVCTKVFLCVIEMHVGKV